MLQRKRLPPLFWVAFALLLPFAVFCAWLMWTTGQIRQRLEASVSGVSTLLEVRRGFEADLAQPEHVFTEAEVKKAREQIASCAEGAVVAGASADLRREISQLDEAIGRLTGGRTLPIVDGKNELFLAMDHVVAGFRGRSRDISVSLGRRWDFLNIAATGALFLSLSNLLLLAHAHQQRRRAEAGQAELDAQRTRLRSVAERWATGDLRAPLPHQGATPDAFERALDELRCNLIAKMDEVEQKKQTIHELDGELRHQLHARSLALAGELSFHAIREAREPAPGDLLAGRYIVEKRVGSGGMGDVWQVRRSTDDKVLALKVLRKIESDRDRLRFLREGALLARVRHPNVVAIYDLGVSPGGVSYLVTEIVAGQRLDDLQTRDLAGGLLPILRAAAEGLCAIHAAGIVHRDLKPANILVAPRESGAHQVKIIDLGIARVIGNDSSEITLPPAEVPAPKASMEVEGAALSSLDATEDGMIVGTPHFIAPELSDGRPPTPAADIFAFGVTAYRVLTGEMPFTIPPSTLRNVELPAPAPLGTRRPDLPPEALSLLDACLLYDPTKRPSAEDLARGLCVKS